MKLIRRIARRVLGIGDRMEDALHDPTVCRITSNADRKAEIAMKVFLILVVLFLLRQAWVLASWPGVQ